MGKTRILIILTVAVAMAFYTIAATAQVSHGKASYYPKRATGARTASGERLHQDSLTCAHRSSPFGTKLLVTNQSNGRQVVVRVNDRGPFIRGRIIDLSYRAALELGMLSMGVATVKVEPYRGDVVVPYRDNTSTELPEIDLDVTVPADPLHPQWQEETENQTTTAKSQTSTPAKPKNTAPANNTPTKTIKPLSAR